jgi:hypothetical protein
MFAQLTPEEWQRYGLHAERGRMRMTTTDLVAQAAGHDLSHWQQAEHVAAAVT